MPKQNIYDNEVFFEGYKELRDSEINANNLFEIPALFSLLPDLKGKQILDLGCGFGEHCVKFVELGAEKVVGIDISQKMLEIAEKENNNPKISYLNMAMEDIDGLNEKFDIVVSSLAMHYIEDYFGVAKNVYNLLENDGLFVFSQEHPLTTSFVSGKRWTKDEKGNKIYLNLANYGVEGERDVSWFVDGVKKYHRTFSTVINTLIDNHFVIEKVLEPLPNENLLNKYPQLECLFHKPDFLLISAKKSK